MIKKYLPLCLIAALLSGNGLWAQKSDPVKKTAAEAKKTTRPANTKTAVTAAKTASSTIDVRKIDPIKLNNQMMMVFMERMKSGNYAEAREIANQMIHGQENFKQTETKEYKSFHSVMEKELYALLEGRKGNKKTVEWVEQPVSDGYYLLSILDFQENKHEDALENMRRAIFWNPVRSAFYTERGFMLLRNNAGPNFLMAQVAYLKALELADNPEDFVAALRGLAFLFTERRMTEAGLACLLVAQHFMPDNNEVQEELFFIRRNFPDLYNSMDLAIARKALHRNRILDTYAPEHVQILIRLADGYKSPKDAPHALALLRKALEMEPGNKEVSRRLQVLEKK